MDRFINNFKIAERIIFSLKKNKNYKIAKAHNSHFIKIFSEYEPRYKKKKCY